MASEHILDILTAVSVAGVNDLDVGLTREGASTSRYALGGASVAPSACSSTGSGFSVVWLCSWEAGRH